MATYTTQEPWTEGFHRLANTVSQIMEARNQRALIEQQLAKQKKAELEEQRINEIFQKAVAPSTTSVPDPSKAPGMGVGMLRPEFQTTQQEVQPTQEEILNRLLMAAIQGGPRVFSQVGPTVSSLSKLSQGPTADPSLFARNIQKPGPDGKTHYYGFNPTTNQYDRDLGVVPEGSFKFTGASERRGSDSNLWRINPVTGNYEVLVQGRGWVYDPKIPVPDFISKEIGRTPASEINKGVQIDTIRGNIARVRDKFKDKWVGPVAGRAYRVQEALTGLADESQSSFYADVNDLGDMLLRARSGAQINEQEYARLRKLVPTPDLPPKVFKERLNRFETQLMQTLEAQQQRLRKGRYLAPTPTPMGPEDRSSGKKEDPLGLRKP